MDDLNTTLNPGATYFVEVQYLTPLEYQWCQSHPGECNMYNNASYRPVLGQRRSYIFQFFTSRSYRSNASCHHGLDRGDGKSGGA